MELSSSPMLTGYAFKIKSNLTPGRPKADPRETSNTPVYEPQPITGEGANLDYSHHWVVCKLLVPLRSAFARLCRSRVWLPLLSITSISGTENPNSQTALVNCLCQTFLVHSLDFLTAGYRFGAVS